MGLFLATVAPRPRAASSRQTAPASQRTPTRSTERPTAAGRRPQWGCFDGSTGLGPRTREPSLPSPHAPHTQRQVHAGLCQLPTPVQSKILLTVYKMLISTALASSTGPQKPRSQGSPLRQLCLLSPRGPEGRPVREPVWSRGGQMGTWVTVALRTTSPCEMNMEVQGRSDAGQDSRISHPGSPSLVLSQELTAVTLAVSFHGTAGGLHTAKAQPLTVAPYFSPLS